MTVHKIIEYLLILDQTKKALEILHKVFEEQQLDRTELTVINGNYVRAKEDKRNGILSKEQERIEFNRINAAILEIKATLPENISWEEQLADERRIKLKYLVYKNQYYILAFFGLLFLGFIGILGFLPKKGIKTELDLTLTNFLFETSNTNQLTLNQDCFKFSVENFNHIAIPSTELSIYNEDNQYSLKTIDNGLIELSGNPMDLPNLNFFNVKSEGIELNKNTILKFSIDTFRNSIKIDINPGSVKVKLNFQDSLRMDGENLSLIDNILRESEDFSLFESVAFIPNDQSAEVIITGHPDILSIYLNSKKSATTINEQRKFKVNNFDFKYMDIDRVEKVSGVIQGNISFVNNKEEIYNNFSIITPYFLETTQCKSVEILSLDIANNRIKMLIRGVFHTVETGSNYDEGLIIRNPSILCWLYNNHFLLLLFLLITVILFIIFINWYPKN